MISFLFAKLLILCYVFSFMVTGKSTDVQYVVIIDCGSTGSKATGYKFHIDRKTKQFVLDDGDVYYKKSPGLATFVNNSTEGAENINELLEIVKKKLEVSPNTLAKTPLALGGTGGMRSIEPEQANSLLDEVRKVFEKSGFLVKKDAVTILSGDDEGIFSWFTTNILLDRWGSGNTVATLDLGGSSTQVTFSTNENGKERSLSDHMFSVKTSSPEEKVDLFTISYSNLGRISFRNDILSQNNSEEASNWYTICMHPDSKPYKLKLTTKSHIVYGAPNKKSVVDFDACRKLVKEKTLSLLTTKPSLLKKQNEIFAFSGYFKVLAEAGLVDSENGGQATIANILSSAEIECSFANDDHPFLCLHLIHIYVLLHDGYELDAETKVNFHQKLNGHYLSWSLGYTYDQLVGIQITKKTNNN